jgi:hypothetical protein
MKTRIGSGLVGLTMVAVAIFGAYPAQASTSASVVVGGASSASQLTVVPFREPVPACGDQVQLVRNGSQIRAVGVGVTVFPPSYPYGLITVYGPNGAQLAQGNASNSGGANVPFTAVSSGTATYRVVISNSANTYSYCAGYYVK